MVMIPASTLSSDGVTVHFDGPCYVNADHIVTVEKELAMDGSASFITVIPDLVFWTQPYLLRRVPGFAHMEFWPHGQTGGSA